MHELHTEQIKTRWHAASYVLPPQDLPSKPDAVSLPCWKTGSGNVPGANMLLAKN